MNDAVITRGVGGTSQRKHSLGNAVRILEDIIVPNLHNTIPTAFQKPCSFLVASNLLFFRMLRTI